MKSHILKQTYRCKTHTNLYSVLSYIISNMLIFRHEWHIAYRLTAIRSSGLPYSGLHSCNPYNHITHLPTPEGWKAELAWLVDAERTFSHEVVTCQTTTEPCRQQASIQQASMPSVLVTGMARLSWSGGMTTINTRMVHPPNPSTDHQSEY